MKDLFKYVAISTFFIVAGIFALTYFQEDKIVPLIPFDSKEAKLNAAFEPMNFVCRNNSGGLIKSKNCDPSEVLLSISPKFKLPTSTKQSLIVLIDEIEYDTITFNGWSSRENLLDHITYDVPIPAFNEFNKEKLPIVCEYYSDNRLVHTIKDTIQYLENGEEISFQEKRGSIGYGGDCKKAKYFENETLYSVNKKGNYFLQKDFITTILKEEDRYKIETNSPPGFLVHMEDKYYKIPVPAYPTEVSYVDLSLDLTPGVYKNSLSQIDGYYSVDDEKLNSYLGYNYNTAAISYKKRIVYNDCVYSELDKECIEMPSGINIRFVDYPEDIPNVYRSL